jgi:hypothetical protein
MNPSRNPPKALQAEDGEHQDEHSEHDVVLRIGAHEDRIPRATPTAPEIAR